MIVGYELDRENPCKVIKGPVTICLLYTSRLRQGRSRGGGGLEDPGDERGDEQRLQK